MAKGPGETLPTIGFLGLGRMGGPMVRNLLQAGCPVVAYDPVAGQLDACVEAGATGAASGGEVVAGSEVVITSLPSSAVFVQVAEEDLLPNARAGQSFIDVGTTEAAETRRLAEAFAARGAALVDAPVSGGEWGAERGTLRVFVGGEADAVERCRPILDVLGDPGRVVHCGPSGAGQVVKGVNQLAMGLGDAAYLEAVAYGVQGGADPAAILQAVGGDEGWRGVFAGVARRVAEGAGNDVLVKFPELPYFLREARERGLNTPLTEALFAYCDPGPRDWVDNMDRPRVAFWHRLTKDGGT